MTAEVVSVPREAVRGLLVREYDALVGSGLLDDEPVELIEGDLVRVVPQKPIHAEAVHRALLALLAQVPRGWTVQSQAPLVAGDRSEPEPDVAVVVDQSYREHHPTAALSSSRSPARRWPSTSASRHACTPPSACRTTGAGRGRWTPPRPLASHLAGVEDVTVHESGTVGTSGEPSLVLDLAAVLGPR